jgi:acetyltransferase-like isoleucine patch superfamily enzyme
LANSSYPQLPELRGRVNSADHAFASGRVFRCPTSLDEAIAITDSKIEGSLLFDIWRQFLSNADVGEGVLLGLGARLINERADQSGATIGHDSVIRGLLRSELSGTIDIGPFVYLGDNSILYARERVSIGAGTLIAHNVNVFDNDTHPIDAGERVAHFQRLLGHKPPVRVSIRAAPVRIGQRCWLAVNSVVCRGVTIGNDTIVSANSVVNTDLPSGVVAAGNPAVPIRELPVSRDNFAADTTVGGPRQGAWPVTPVPAGRYATPFLAIGRMLRRLLVGVR